MKTPKPALTAAIKLLLLGALLASPPVSRAAIATGANLAVSKSANTNSLPLGAYVNFTVGVSNLGPTTASNIDVSDLIPPGLSYTSSVAPPDSLYNPTNGAWTVATLVAGAGRVLTIQAQAISTGPVTNHATLVSSSPSNTNSAGNSASAGLVVTSPATNPPILLICPSNITTTATSSNGAVVTYFAMASGGCSPPPTVTFNPPSGSTFQVGMSNVICTASDTCGDHTNCSFLVTVYPPSNAPPIVLTCSTNLTVTATSSNGVVVFYNSTATGGCSTPMVNCSPPSGSLFPVGTNTVSCIAGDTCGDYTNCSFVVTVNPPSNAPPIVVTCSTNITVTATSSNGAVVTYTSTASGGCSPPIVNCSPPSGSIFPVGTNMITCTATNTCGQTTNCGFIVTVYPPLVLNCSSNITVTATSANGAVVNYTSTATGGCNPPPTVTCTPPSGSLFPVGTNMVTCTASNTCGQTTNCGFAVTVVRPTADLSISKSANTNVVNIGETVVFHLQLSNGGPDPATNTMTVNDLVPSGFDYVSDNAYLVPGNTYSFGAGVWYLQNGVGASNASVALDITTRARTDGSFTNVASINVPSNLNDPTSNDNTASVVVVVLPLRSLSGFARSCSTNGPPLPYVTVTLTGLTNQTTTTDPNGFYTFTNLVGGNYMVTPAQPGNSFAPPNAAVALNTNLTLAPFVGATALIQGTVRYGTTNGPPIPDQQVLLSWSPAPGVQTNRSVRTDATGRYIFTNTAPANYTVTPVATNGFVFTPTNAAVNLTGANCSGVANFVSKTRAVQLVALEVTQVIQDWSNSVTLIAGKDTYVRAHLQLTNPPPVLVQHARLYGTGPGGSLTGSPLSPFNSNGVVLVQTTNAADPAIRLYLTNSLDFYLPLSWTTGTVTLQLVATNNLTVVPTNTVPSNSTVQVTFTQSPVLPVKFAAFNWTNWAVAGNPFQMVSPAAYADLPARLLSIYPVPKLTLNKAVLVPPTTLPVPQKIPDTIPKSEKMADWAILNANAKLVQMRAFDQLTRGFFGGGTNWIYYGAIAGPSPGTEGWAGAIVTTSNTISYNGGPLVSSGFVETNFYNVQRHTHSHEIGHNLGRPHDINNATTLKGVCREGAPAGTPLYPLFQPVPPAPTKPALGPMTNGANSLIFGLDTLTLATSTTNPVVSPYVYFDVMSYCDVAPLDVWNSSFTYAVLRTNIANMFKPPPPPPPPSPPVKWFFARGYLNTVSNLASLFPFWNLTTTATNPPAGSPPGTYYAIVYDISGNVLQQIPFAPDPYIVEQGDTNDITEGLFTIPVLANPAFHQVQIWDSINNVILANIIASTNLPAVNLVTLSSTNGGAFPGSGPLEISWSASDTDPNAQLTYTIQYSADGGTSWDTLDVDWPGQSYEIDSQYLSATTQGLIRVAVSDGFNSPDPTVSSPFTVLPHPPVVRLNSPMEGALYIGDQQILLDAFVNDPQDGPLDGTSVQWTSSRDGLLGYGDTLTFEADALSEGRHLLTVTATDSLSLTTSASLEIVVLRRPQPQLALNVSGSQVLVSWDVGVTNFVLESTAALAAPSNWAAITNKPVAADDQQTVTLGLSGSSQFFRLRLP